MTGNIEISNALALFLNELFGTDIAEDVTYTGADEGIYLVKDFSIKPTSSEKSLPVYNYGAGVMLTSGGYPGSENTMSNFSVVHDTPGDVDLTNTAQEAFSGAGETNDASIIEFTVNVTNPEVDALRASLVFGSEEYPEYVDSDFVDIGALYVNGVNYAGFEATGKPLSIIADNLESGVFIDNGEPGSADYGIEWDGFSKELVVRAPLKQGINTIKIGVADTGDTILDSGLFVSELSLIGGGGTGDGVLSVITPDASGSVDASVASEEITLNDQKNTVTGTAEELNGDVVVGFKSSDVINISQSFFDISNVIFSAGSVIMDIDTNQDGDSDTKLTFAGQEDFDNFEFSQSESGTAISLKEQTTEEPEPPSPSTLLANFVGVLADEGWEWPSELTDELRDTAILVRYPEIDSMVNPVVRLYTGILDRAAEREGLEYWTTQLNAGNNLDKVTQAFMSAQEVNEALQTMGSGDGAFVDALYQTMLGRAADEDGRDYWLEQLLVNNVEREDVALAFVNSEEFVDASVPLVNGNKLMAWGVNLEQVEWSALGIDSDVAANLVGVETSLEDYLFS